MRVECRNRNPSMKHCAVLFAAFASCMAGALEPASRRPIAITDVTIVDVEHGQTTAPRTVLIDAGRIAAIVAPADARIPADA